MMLSIQSAAGLARQVFFVFLKTLRSSWRCAGVESEAGRILLVCRSLIPGSRILLKKL